MKINVLCVTSHSDRPETETFIGLHRAGVSIRVLCPPVAPHRQRLIDAGVPVFDLSLNSRVDKHGILVIRKYIIDDEINILHLFNNKAASNGILAATNIPVKIICYRGIVANVSFLDPMSWMTYLNPRVDKIVCVAEAIRKYFLDMRFFKLRVPPKKVVTIYKGHDLEWYNKQPADLNKEFSIPSDAFVVGCVANIRPRKGIEILIKSTYLLPQNKSIHILLIGNMESKKLQQLINESPLSDQIHLTGFRRDAPELVSACNVAVLPSLKREGLPKTVIEAMAYSVTPIVTNSGGSPELIVHNESGLVVPPADAEALAEAIKKLMDNPIWSQTLGRNARLRIMNHFKIETTIDQTLCLYKELLSDTKE